jgi:hypothetical protein
MVARPSLCGQANSISKLRLSVDLRDQRKLGFCIRMPLDAIYCGVVGILWAVHSCTAARILLSSTDLWIAYTYLPLPATKR